MHIFLQEPASMHRLDKLSSDVAHQNHYEKMGKYYPHITDMIMNSDALKDFKCLAWSRTGGSLWQCREQTADQHFLKPLMLFLSLIRSFLWIMRNAATTTASLTSRTPLLTEDSGHPFLNFGVCKEITFSHFFLMVCVKLSNSPHISCSKRLTENRKIIVKPNKQCTAHLVLHSTKLT